MVAKYAVCIVPVAHVRLVPNHRAEMVTQLLFGDTIEILDIDADGWIHAECIYDNYKGYCRSNQVILLDELYPETDTYSSTWAGAVTWNGQRLMIPYGCDLSLLQANLPGHVFTYTEEVHHARRTGFSEENIRTIAGIFLNTAYLWGARSVFGIDCSGYAQSVYKMMNIKLPRDANMQVSCGEGVGFLQEARCGDLAFFDEDDAITHVGILLNDHEIIHASGNVRIDRIDNEGIIHSDTKKRTHHLRVIKRIVV